MAQGNEKNESQKFFLSGPLNGAQGSAKVSRKRPIVIDFQRVQEYSDMTLSDK